MAIGGIWVPEIAIPYSAIDLFYPGGWPGYPKDGADRVIENKDNSPLNYLDFDPMGNGIPY